MTDKILDDIQRLIDNKIEEIPDKYKNNSVPSGSRCTLSYNTGYRDALITIKTMVEYQIMAEYYSKYGE
tara:strand:+ start:13461 stop:13667 length:207 start_codon:yes stop_codon:yes gene_type:complete